MIHVALQYWWTPIVLLWYFVYAWLSKENQALGGKWLFILWAWGAWPGWAIVSRHSKNLMLDGIIYDSLILLSFYVGLTIFSGQVFNNQHYTGIGIILFGFLLFQTAGKI